jgi:hypothetical protein
MVRNGFGAEGVRQIVLPSRISDRDIFRPRTRKIDSLGQKWALDGWFEAV